MILVPSKALCNGQPPREAFNPSYGVYQVVRLILTASIPFVQGDAHTPHEVTWDGQTPYQPVQLVFVYKDAYAAYWSNAVVLGTGVMGLVLYYGRDLLRRETEALLKNIYARLCVVACIFSVVATVFTVRRWQTVSKTYLENNASDLEIPFIMSIVACFLHVLPGSAGLFAPILTLMSVTYKHYHPPAVSNTGKLCNKKIVLEQGKFRDIHNDHGIQWTLTKPVDNDNANVNMQNPHLLENFQLVYRHHKESANSRWRSQLRKLLRRARDPNAISRITMQSSRLTGASLPAHPSTFDTVRHDESGCVVEETYSEMTSQYTEVSGQPSSGLTMPDSASDVIRELISENMKHPDTDTIEHKNEENLNH
ncbi:uncharacterized protein LOC129590297 [Paramacrobiotus metropolitanus]|uniref:uncharacterized protein LOC129590297 n=1 Tax=Paramacrobiotus metropolitanus TaxID=2943436 RepID=UPI0024461066|nr:uncharacterized protein LOC129590297 [Paramacrobiotus metropolitanus]